MTPADRRVIASVLQFMVWIMMLIFVGRKPNRSVFLAHGEIMQQLWTWGSGDQRDPDAKKFDEQLGQLLR